MVPALRTYRPCAMSASAKSSNALIGNTSRSGSLTQRTSLVAADGAVDGFNWGIPISVSKVDIAAIIAPKTR
jgi:hypothetical protein